MLVAVGQEYKPWKFDKSLGATARTTASKEERNARTTTRRRWWWWWETFIIIIVIIIARVRSGSSSIFFCRENEGGKTKHNKKNVARTSRVYIYMDFPVNFL